MIDWTMLRELFKISDIFFNNLTLLHNFIPGLSDELFRLRDAVFFGNVL